MILQVLHALIITIIVIISIVICLGWVVVLFFGKSILSRFASSRTASGVASRPDVNDEESFITRTNDAASWPFPSMHDDQKRRNYDESIQERRDQENAKKDVDQRLLDKRREEEADKKRADQDYYDRIKRDRDYQEQQQKRERDEQDRRDRDRR